MKFPLKVILFYSILPIFLTIFSCSYKNITTSPEKFPVTITSDENGSVCGAGTYQVAEGDSLIVSICHVAEHYKFKNWIVTSGADSCILWNKFNDTTVIKNVIGAVSVTATFELEKFTLIVDQPSVGGTITIAPESLDDKYDNGQQVILTATADIGYKWIDWSGISSSTGTVTVKVSKDLSIGATFNAISVPAGVICAWLY